MLHSKDHPHYYKLKPALRVFSPLQLLTCPSARGHSNTKAVTTTVQRLNFYFKASTLHNMTKPIQRIIVSQTKDKSISTISLVDEHGLTQPLYTVHQSRSKPHLQIRYLGQGAQIVGTVVFHSLFSKIDISLHGTDFTHGSQGLLFIGTHFRGPESR
jgi:hypothetical protein